ncbi:MAG: thiamine diphosphokinase [Catonella sp.]|jgi:thiamine pyrophosphokinase|nr:thiamine diphosphokinase [Catonella sp.]MDY6355878.1 thiamine diphosphokinase [Catonella sp.]
MKNILIISGGSVEKFFAGTIINKYKFDCFIAADRGIETYKSLDIIPDYMVGDFDSADGDLVSSMKSEFAKSGKPIIKQFNPEKDYTDTELAIKTALTLSPDNLVIMGATGTRLDHAYANIGLLQIAMESGVNTCILDSHNRITMHDEAFTIKASDKFSRYFSLLPYTDCVEKLSIEGAKYELKDFLLTKGNSLTVSNELVGQKDVNVSFTDGIVILFESRD